MSYKETENKQIIEASTSKNTAQSTNVLANIIGNNHLDDSFLIEQLLTLNKLKAVRRMQNTALKNLTKSIRELDNFDSEVRNKIFNEHQKRMLLNEEFKTKLGLNSIMRTVEELKHIPTHANISGDIIEPESGLFGRNNPSELLDRLEKISSSVVEAIPDAKERNGFINMMKTMFKEGGITKGIVNDVADTLYDKIFSEKNKNIILLLSVLTIIAYTTLNRTANSFALLIIITGIFAYAYTGKNKTEIMATLALFDIVNAGILGHKMYQNQKKESIVNYCIDSVVNDVEDISENLKEMKRKVLRTTPESGIDTRETDLIGPFNLLFSAATVAFTGKNVPSDVYNKVLNFDRNTNSLTSIYNVIVNAINSIMKFCRDKLDVDVPELLKFGRTEVDDILVRVDNILLMEAKDKYYRNNENYFELEVAIMDMRKIIIAIERTSKNSNLLVIMHKELNKLERLSKEFAQANIDGQGAKQETVCVLFKGGPGCGKSIAMEHLAFAVVAQVLSTPEEYEKFKANPYTYIFNRQFENKYWDGYKPSMLVTYIDDFGQAKDVSGEPDNEYMNVIRIVNGFQCSLHTANMTEKGRLTFQSPFLIMSSNLHKFEPQSINCHDALNRRFTLNLVTTLKLKYTSLRTKGADIWHRKPDISKCERDENGKPIMAPYMLEFYHSDEEGRPQGAPFDFDTVVEMTMEAYRERKHWAVSHRKEFLKTADKWYELETAGIEDMTITEVSTDKVISNNYTKCMETFNNQVVKMVETPQEDIKDVSELVEDLQMTAVSESGSALELDPKIKAQYNNTLHRRFWKNHINRVFKTHESVRDNIIFVIEKKYSYYPMWEKKIIYKQIYKAYIAAEADERDMFNYIDYVKRYAKRAVYTRICPGIKLSIDNIMTEMDDLMMKNETYAMVTTYFKELPKIMLVMGVVIAGLGSFFAGKGIWNAIERYRNKDNQETESSNETPVTSTEPQSHGFGHKAPKEKVKTASTVKALKALRAQPEIGDTNGLNIIKSLVKKHIWTLTLHPEGKMSTKLGHMIGVYGNQYIMPFHFAKELAAFIIKNPDDRTSFITFSRDNGNSIPYRIVDIYQRFSFDNLQVVDACILSMPLGFPRSSDNRKYFASENEHNSSLLQQEFVLYTNRGGNTTLLTGFATKNSVPLCMVSPNIEEYYVPTSYAYQGGLTMAGDCGGPLFILNCKVPTRKIYGFHVSAQKSKGIGFSNILTIEMIEKDLSFEDQIVSEEIDIPFDDTIVTESGMVYEGKVQAAPYNTKCNIIRSKLHDKVIESKQAIAFINKFRYEDKLIDPMQEALKRYCLSRQPILLEDIMRSCRSTFSFIEENTIIHIERRRLTFDESIEGFNDNPYLGSITSGTSAGYPHVLNAATNSKKAFYSNRELYQPQLESRINELIETMKKGIRPIFFFQDQLKLERLPKEKVFRKTRLFSGVDWHYLILVRIYFGSFMAHCTANNIEIGMSAGVNAFSDDWDALARKLTQFDNYHDINSTHTGAGDYKSFDGSLNSVMLESIGIFVNKWYGLPDNHPDNLVRKVLWQEVINSRHVARDGLYTWLGSLPSGHPMTFIINCLYGLTAMRYCFFKRVKGVPFETAVYVVTGGDDNAFTVKKEFREFFNEITLAEDMSDLGLTYTTELKGKAESKFRTIDKIEFLKRRFLFDKDARRYIAPLNLDTILEIPMWTKAENPSTIAVNNIVESLNELSLWYKHWDQSQFYYTKILRLYRENYNGVKASTPIFMDIEDRKHYVLSRGTHIII